MRHRFAEFILDTRTRQLLEGGREVHLSPKAFELLLLLIEGRSRALSKAELQDQLWPSTFVGETNLATLVAEIRRGLGESAQSARIVRTVHRFGYRFVAEVHQDDTARGETIHRAVEMYLITHDQQYRLAEGEALIGRARDAAIRLDSGGVSRHHARLVVSGIEATIEDLGSKNGTWLRDERLTRARELTDGDEVSLGSARFTFRRARSPRSTESTEMPRPVSESE